MEGMGCQVYRIECKTSKQNAGVGCGVHFTNEPLDAADGEPKASWGKLGCTLVSSMFSEQGFKLDDIQMANTASVGAAM